MVLTMEQMWVGYWAQMRAMTMAMTMADLTVSLKEGRTDTELD